MIVNMWLLNRETLKNAHGGEEMLKEERYDRILEILEEETYTDAHTLAERLYVSMPTIRRDLKALAEQGKIIRTHGGAFLSSFPGESVPQELREREFVQEKDGFMLIRRYPHFFSGVPMVEYGLLSNEISLTSSGT